MRPIVVAHADAWEVQGRLREPFGGAAAELHGIRLMASGLPEQHVNGGDVTAAEADVDGAREFFAARGVPWGVRVPVELPWRHGRRLLHRRLMGLPRERLRAAPRPRGLTIRAAGPEDIDAVVAVDGAAFGIEQPGWMGPLLAADRVVVALAELDGAPAGAAYSLRSDGRAGPCLYLAGVGVVAAARRRGVGSAVSSWLLERGFAAGARLAHLSPDHDAAARVYGRLGFAEAPGFDVYVEL
jgi:GNAT superfamily N-acetyltransferase